MSLTHLLLVIATLLVMEFAVALFHRHVMHGFGWAWHASHHEPRKASAWERNDLYAVVFTAAAIALFALGDPNGPVWWIAFGITLYGLLYGLLHDVLIHRRLPLAWKPRNRYLQRLIAAHHMHHAVKTRENGVSFGFLYAPPVEQLRAELRRRNGQA
ncbi:beta-carotene 3-hydroxylase [Noviherbaspirillum humi]|uniref:Beta-carotene 3-hydroxylase n=1 Tax=Noviherbaspirillum humi TaxID=1688639 RepID=A0A239L2U6_9BURK|nr:sterol desaturase family protein [Noviherbaspirillum humi]SNT24781.1 beta-carotene 3-hydroxylase [Noviherbaspirillum humi]